MGYPLLTFDLSLAPPGKMTWPTVVGGSATGGTSMSGISSSVDVTGGGFVIVKYAQLALGNFSPRHLRYASRLAAALNSGVRPIVVPFLTDVTAPTPNDAANFDESSFTDDTKFSDGTDFSANATGAQFASDYPVSAATVAITTSAGSMLVGGEWFSVLHDQKSYRAYCVTDVDGVRNNANGTATFTVGIRPTLREAVARGQQPSFNRPRCVMKLRQGTQIDVDVDVGMLASPEISFEEFFGVLP